MGMFSTKRQDEGKVKGDRHMPAPSGWLHWGLMRKQTILFLTSSAKLAHLQKPEAAFLM